MVIAHNESDMERCMKEAIKVSPKHPVLLDKFLEDAIEVDVDALCDGEEVYIGGIMEHIEYAGIHSGDSACILPPRTLLPETIEMISDYTKRLALALEVKGLINIQYAVYGMQKVGHRVRGSLDFPKDKVDSIPKVFVLEVNPRASRTVPYVSKATGVPLAKVAARVMVGHTLKQEGLKGMFNIKAVAVKEAVLPFNKFMNVDPLLGPEMRSTGEVMGMDKNFGIAFAKAQDSVGLPLPNFTEGMKTCVLISVNEHDREDVVEVAGELVELGFDIEATNGTHRYLNEHDIPSGLVFKLDEGRPNCYDNIISHKYALVINTPLELVTQLHELKLRRAAVEHNVPYVTTISAARAAVEGIKALKNTPQYTVTSSRNIIHIT